MNFKYIIVESNLNLRYRKIRPGVRFNGLISFGVILTKKKS